MKAKILAAICMFKNGQKDEADKIIKKASKDRMKAATMVDLARYYQISGDDKNFRLLFGEVIRVKGLNREDCLGLIELSKCNNKKRTNVVPYLIFNWQPVGNTYKDLQLRSLINPGDFSMLSNQREDEEYGNLCGNIDSLGLAVQKGGWIYYCSNEEGKIYKSLPDGSCRTKLTEHGGCYINVVGNWIYYRSFLNHTLFKTSTDGNNTSVLSTHAAKSISVVGDWIYYLTRDYEGNYKLHKMKTDGTQEMNIGNDNCRSFCVGGEWIYYSNESDGGSMYKVRTDGTGRVKLNDDNSHSINVSGEWLYFIKVVINYDDPYKSTLCKMRIDGSEKALVKDACVRANVAGDWIYYFGQLDNNDRTSLYKMHVDGTNSIQLVDDGSGIEPYINLAGDWIYYCSPNPIDSKDRLFKIKIDGTEKQEVQ